MNGFTKLYKEEIDLIYKTNSISALKVYTHLKDKHRYYKQDIYDYISCMSQSLEMSVRTIKEVIKKLKANKTYYVRVRGINGTKQGKWSKTKKIKIKK